MFSYLGLGCSWLPSRNVANDVQRNSFVCGRDAFLRLLVSTFDSFHLHLKPILIGFAFLVAVFRIIKRKRKRQTNFSLHSSVQFYRKWPKPIKKCHKSKKLLLGALTACFMIIFFVLTSNARIFFTLIYCRSRKTHFILTERRRKLKCILIFFCRIHKPKNLKPLEMKKPEKP